MAADHELARFDAIVIGASAGGVEALQALVRSLPADLSAAVMVVLHLPPERPSGVAELLAPQCGLPVMEALDKQPAPRGQVAIAPPDYHLLVEPDGSLALSVDDPVRYSRPAIDPLFESAAVTYGSRLLALLLTGGSDDGSAGVAAVRRRGGTVWVQDPATAVAETMPASALAQAGADAVLSVAQMCQRFAAAESPEPMADDTNQATRRTAKP